MKRIFKMLAAVTAFATVAITLTACGNAPADPTIPQVEKAIRINATDVEIYFADGYTGTETPDVTQFEIKDDKGNAVELSQGYGYGGGVFFDNMLTLRLAQNFAEDDTAL